MERFNLLNRANADYIDRLYAQYRQDPQSVDETWQAFFAGFEAAGGRNAMPNTTAGVTGASAGHLTLGVHNLIHSYRELGHFVARLDPLGHDRPTHPLLELSQFNITPADFDRPIGKADFAGDTDGTLGDLIAKMRDTYTGTIGVEFMDIADKAQREWLTQRMEPILNRPAYSREESRALLFQLIAAEEFERFLHTRYVGQKRFSLEGAEAVIPLLNTIVDDGAALGVEEICMGMAHRGRLNVLAHVLNKPYEVLFSEFEGTLAKQESEGDGDVKYHLGYANDRPAGNGCIHLSLSPNPSHLELIDPVVVGIVRAKQTYRDDKEQRRIVPLLIHGDAAFTGQGIVHETLNLSELPGYRTGGTIHLIINNQIGFTTTPFQGRFTPYPTDVAKMIQAPIFHVNGDDPEACVHAARLAIGFREQFKCDVMIDVWCYRRHGHNEVDVADFTQPLMYQEIAAKKSVRELYAEKLIAEGKLTAEELETMRNVARERMEAAANLAKEIRPRQRSATMNNLWRGMTSHPTDWNARTAQPRSVLTTIAETCATLPPDFTIHPKLKKIWQARYEMVKSGTGIDWGCGEMLALGSLLLEGTPIRFTGQDVQRGTFSHRHAVLHDYKTGESYVPLAHLSPSQAKFTILNTMLSELAVLGFEYGFSSGDPRNLVIWEAQFGDFINEAQPIVDQFIAASESKWHLMNGLVLLLPHGFEGQGPEHSNAYLERFLALCAEDNLQVCVPTHPAQYFHLLRRQIHRRFRKPLVLMMPKGLLRFAPSASNIEDFTDASFRYVLDDPTQPERDSVRRVIFCSGKVYYTLAAARSQGAIKGVAIARVEQLYPFPQKEIQSVLAKYRQTREVCWVQEEPKNRGAWRFMEDRLRDMLPEMATLIYCGREESASPAAGSFDLHREQEEAIVAAALKIPSATVKAGELPATAISPRPVSD
ncbi:MAG TPA: 2-oxoglutarate dehydrogenase E1 component [Tepidisphaeraceae bacterium]|jgi:2-oxoglutarate dehydrogenase E1 component|nr:2-oxoglutarate dehydrogenase E1 component [Tepidisphaeraceae bacterium]